MKPIVIYVAGPYTGKDSWEREQNIRRAEQVHLELLKLGHAPICVHTQARYWFGHVSEDVAKEYDLVLLRLCGAVVLVEGWENSKGSREEIREAQELGIPVYESVDAFKAGQSMVFEPPQKQWLATKCLICGTQQFRTPQGVNCGKGHKARTPGKPMLDGR